MQSGPGVHGRKGKWALVAVYLVRVRVRVRVS